MTTALDAAGTPSAPDLAEATSSDAALRRFLDGLPGVDQVGAEARAAMLGSRSIKTTAKAQAIDLAIRIVDLTTLEGQDTPGKVRALCTKAMRPDPADPTCPPTAAVCVYGDLVGVAKACGIADTRAMTTMAEVEAFAPTLQNVSSGPRFASVKIDAANLERVLSSRDANFIVNRIRGALGFQPI